METEREHHTKHGLHMNKKGKEYITRKIADNIKSLFAKQKSAPITLEWTKNPGMPTSTTTDQDANQGITGTADPSNMKRRVEEEIDSQKRQDHTSQERPRLDGSTTDVTHKANNGSRHEEEVMEEEGPLITINKRKEEAPKRVSKQPVTRGTDFLWEV